MSYENKGSVAPKAIVTSEPDRSGNYICNGTSDETDINRAISELTSGRTRKEKILLKGDFTIDDPIVMDSYTILELIGKVTLANNGNSDLLDADTKTDFEILGGKWDGNKANQGDVGLSGFDLDNCDDVLIKEIELYNLKRSSGFVGGRGIDTLECSGLDIIRNKVHDLGNWVDSSGQSEAMFLHAVTDTLVFGNRIWNCNAGIYFYGSGTINRAIENYVRDVARGGISMYSIEAYTLSYCHAIGNIIRDASRDGAHSFIATGQAGSTIHCIISNNILYETGDGNYADAGILLQEGTSFTKVIDNTLYNMYRRAIQCMGDNCKIDGNLINTVRAAGHYGIELTAASSTCIVTDNELYTIPNAVEIFDANGWATSVKHNNFEDENGWVA